MYLEGRSSGDVPIDDEDDQEGDSGSGSGDYSKDTTVPETFLIYNCLPFVLLTIFNNLGVKIYVEI